MGAGGAVDPQILAKTIFLGKNWVKFGQFVNFSGKSHVKFGHFVNFSCIFSGEKSCPPKLTELLRLWFVEY